MKSARKDTGMFLSSTSKMSSGITSMVGKLAVAGGAFLSLRAAYQGLSTGFKLASDFEQAEVAMTTMIGSGEKAKQLLADLTDFAASTPFQFPELQQATTKLLAFGESADNIIPTMKMLGDIASGVGTPVSELAEIYGKARVAGRLMAEDVNQLVGRGIPVISEFAKMFGVAESEVKGLVTQGKIGFPELQKAMASMTSEGGQFAGLMDAQSQTLGGLFSTLKDNVGLALRDIAQNIIKAFNLKAAMGNVIGFLGTMRTFLGGVLASVGSKVTVLAATIGSVWAGIRDNVLAGVVAYLSTMAPYVIQLGRTTIAVISAVAGGVATGFAKISEWLSAFTGWLGLGGNALEGFKNLVIAALAVVEFSFTNWKSIVELAALSVALSVVKLGNQISHVFTDVIPSVLKWLSKNWFDLLVDISNFTNTVFLNIGKNIVDFFKAIPGLMAGTTSFADIWTPLTDGFEATLTTLPDIAKRAIGPLEAQLGKDVSALGDDLGDGLAEHLAKRMGESDKTSAGVAGMFDTIKDQFNMPDAGSGLEFPDLKMEDETKDLLKDKDLAGSGASAGSAASASSLSLSRSVLAGGPAGGAKKQEVKDPAAEEQLKKIHQAILDQGAGGSRAA